MQVNDRYNGQAIGGDSVYENAMTNAWFDRLEKAIRQDGRSLRAISTAAKCSPNFLQQLLKDRKEPGITRLMSILEVLGTASTLYVLTGIEVTREDEEFFRLVLNLPPEKRADALAFFQFLQARSSGQAPAA